MIMRKSGFVFPGQGSQKQGMLAELAGEYDMVAETFREASRVLDLDLWGIARDNEQGLLDQTHITQPVLLTASVAVWRIWQSLKAPQPELLAGHSLGEYSALVCAQVLDFATAVDLVHKRGQYMQRAVPGGEGAMAAIIGMDDDRITEICRRVEDESGAVVSAANFNAPGQTVIAGSETAVHQAMEACKEAGAKRALPLKVSVPSHCALMKPAAEKLENDLAMVTFSTPQLPVIQNINGRVVNHPDEIRANLVKQLYMPVQWVDSMACMRDLGAGTIVECGPGRVLGGLIKRISRDIDCHGSEDIESLQQARQAVGG